MGYIGANDIVRKRDEILQAGFTELKKIKNYEPGSYEVIISIFYSGVSLN